MSAISGLVSGSVSVYVGSTQSMSAARRATRIAMTATEYDLQLNYHHVIPITGALSPPQARINLKTVNRWAPEPELL